ncbi:MAG: DnaA/Hda family protein [Pseudomonadota bacterium]
MTNQLSFELPVGVSYGAADFHPGTASETARAMLTAPERWPNGKLILIGATGAGKTHLLQIWAQAQGAAVVDAANLPHRASTPVAVDGADAVAGNAEAEEALFHLHNNLAAEGHALLLTARQAPPLWGLRLPDLKSRMEATTVVPIGPPDDATLQAILIKLMADRQLIPAPNLVGYLVARMERSYADAARVIAALDHLSLSEKRKITTALAARVLDAAAE